MSNPRAYDGTELVRCRCARREGRIGLVTYKRAGRVLTAPCPDCKGTPNPGWCLPVPHPPTRPPEDTP